MTLYCKLAVSDYLLDHESGIFLLLRQIQYLFYLRNTEHTSRILTHSASKMLTEMDLICQAILDFFTELGSNSCMWYEAVLPLYFDSISPLQGHPSVLPQGHVRKMSDNNHVKCSQMCTFKMCAWREKEILVGDSRHPHIKSFFKFTGRFSYLPWCTSGAALLKVVESMRGKNRTEHEEQSFLFDKTNKAVYPEIQ